MSRFGDVVEALSKDDVAANIDSLKGAVHAQLAATDSRVQIHQTEYFNHHFVPDFVLSWPGAKDERYLYLRTSSRTASLLRDIEVLADEKPILMPLGNLTAEDDSVQESAKMTDVLIASPASLEKLEDRSAEKPVVGLLSHAVLQGGRGVVTPELAEASSQDVGDGFDGAQLGDSESTSAAIETAGSLLDSFRASQINRLLHAVWVGSGAAGSAFPGAAGITATLDAESLRFVLELAVIDDDDFWRRLGSGLTLNRVCELGQFGSTSNLQRLLKDHAYRFEAKACRALRSKGASSTGGPSWSVQSRNLALTVGDDTLYFAPFKLDELVAPGGDAVSITLAQLRSRANTAGVVLKEIGLADGGSAVSVSNEDGHDLSSDAVVETLARALPTGELRSATVRTATHDLGVTFGTRTAAGYGPARFSVATLVDVALPIIIGASDEDASAARQLLEQPESSTATEEVAETDEPHSIADGSDEPDA